MIKYTVFFVIYLWHYLLGRLVQFAFGQIAVCRFYPSCSQFAAQAIEKFGVFTGTRIALSRILRCHPWGGAGIDLIE